MGAVSEIFPLTIAQLRAGVIGTKKFKDDVVVADGTVEQHEEGSTEMLAACNQTREIIFFDQKVYHCNSSTDRTVVPLYAGLSF